MFRCDGGHLTQSSDKGNDVVMRMTRIPVAIREVLNQHYVPDPKGSTLVGTVRASMVDEKKGTEIVEEGQFCSGCVARIRLAPVVVNPGSPDIRTHLTIPTRHAARQGCASG